MNESSRLRYTTTTPTQKSSIKVWHYGAFDNTKNFRSPISIATRYVLSEYLSS